MYILRSRNYKSKGLEVKIMAEKIVRKKITLTGFVQGIGFRPFINKAAFSNNLKGWVNNSSLGVHIDVEGKQTDINCFLLMLKHKLPPLAKVEKMHIEDKPTVNYIDFEIRPSAKEENTTAFIPPDIGICQECLRDIRDMNNKRYRYPFTTCTNCGPRYSIIKKLPYDRAVTTMSDFPMCNQCLDEYADKLERRFHAQTNACPLCGPKLELLDKWGKEILAHNYSDVDVLQIASGLIKQGNVLAVKGLGGFQITCDAHNEKAVQRIRERKHRPTKPLALMMKDMAVIKNYCSVSSEEEKILASSRSPIVLLTKKNELLPDSIAPASKNLGVMLPYTPLHYLLFDQDLDVLVMTSANLSGLPMLYKNEEAKEKLSDMADYLLVHNRDIHLPVDDSVSRVILKEERVIRPARGYAPSYIKLTCQHSNEQSILACGSHYKNTFAIAKNDMVIISQYIGDLENVETYQNFVNSIEYLQNIYNISPQIAAYDMHPAYGCFDYVNKFTNKIAVFHHHAHIVSCMVENKVKHKLIGIAYDGIGYGTDGNVWGSEYLLCDYQQWQRVGHINYVSMPGGDGATKEPWKMAVSYLYKTYQNENEVYNKLPTYWQGKPIQAVLKLIKNNINSPRCSSMGRLFDAVSALIGFSGKITFEGEAAVLLENMADQEEKGRYDYQIDFIKDQYIINTDGIIKGVIKDVNNSISANLISMKFHNTVAAFSVEMCILLAEKYNISEVALSGGVFQNAILLKNIYERLVSQGFKVYTHKLIPCNDSGLCLGQLAVAMAKCRE